MSDMFVGYTFQQMGPRPLDHAALSRCEGMRPGEHFFAGKSRVCACGKSQEELDDEYLSIVRAEQETKEMGWP